MSQGNAALQLLQRVDRANHFLFLEEWDSPASREAAAHTPERSRFDVPLRPMLIAPYDERPHLALAVASPAPASGEAAALHVVTHADAIPTRREEGTAAVRHRAEQGRGLAGNRRFDAWTQQNRPNHMTLVEAWENEKARSEGAASPAVVAFRHEFGPMSGGLYDDRIYKVVR